MAKKDRDLDRGIEPRDTNPSMGADDDVEQLRGTADEEGDDLDDEDDEDEMDEDDDEEGTF